MTTPHAKCNWVIQDKILMGAFPLESDIPAIIETGITLFVNLTDKTYDLPIITNKTVELIHFPIPTSKTRNYKETVALLNDLLSKYNNGSRLYIHCNGGIGRAGMITSMLIGLINKIDAVDAIELVQKCRLSRPDQSRDFVPLPESNMQVKQIGKILGVGQGKTLPDRSDRSYIKRL